MHAGIASAERVAGKVVVDAFCGVGGNAVHFAQRCRHVIGIDNCLSRLELAQQNARVYGVANRLDLLCTDYFDLRDQLKVLPFSHPFKLCRLVVITGPVKRPLGLSAANSQFHPPCQHNGTYL